MASKESPLKRDNTMQVTAKEGVQYLKDEGKQTLLKLQGLESDAAAGKLAAEQNSGGEPKLAKGTTMVATAKEGEAYVESQGGLDADAKTRKQQEDIDKLKEEEDSAAPAKKPRLSKDTTIHATAAEAKELLGPEKLGDSRSQTKEIREKPSPPKRAGTMEATAKEGAEWYTRGDGGGKNDKSPEAAAAAVKRSGTMQATAKEGEQWLERQDGDDTAAAGQQVKRSSTMEATAKAGEEWVNRDASSK